MNKLEAIQYHYFLWNSPPLALHRFTFYSVKRTADAFQQSTFPTLAVKHVIHRTFYYGDTAHAVPLFSHYHASLKIHSINTEVFTTVNVTLWKSVKLNSISISFLIHFFSSIGNMILDTNGSKRLKHFVW